MCKHLVEDKEIVTLINRFDDGDWSFSCGKCDHSDDDFVYAGIGHLLELDKSLHVISNLRCGYEAERVNAYSEWVIRRFSET